MAEISPVVIAIQTTPSFKKLGVLETIWAKILVFLGIRKNEIGLWKPETSKKLNYGHAVCVVGYDDDKFGGVFKVVNSYGSDWGDSGFFYIRYSDYTKYCKYAYQLIAKPSPGEKQQFEFNVKMILEGIIENEPRISLEKSDGIQFYQINEPLKTGRQQL